MTTPRKSARGKAAAPSAPPVSLPSELEACPETQRFRARLEPDHTSLQWTVVRLPFDPASVWRSMRRLRAAGKINGVPFRTSLFPAPSGQAGYTLLVNKRMQHAAGVSLGSTADFMLAPDLMERPSTLPPELLSAFGRDRKLLRWTQALSESTRREMAKWIAGVKSPAARERRALQMAERLLLAMDGEREMPPVLSQLFARSSRAQEGWLRMTPNQRRGHLLGIFYYQTPEARERRARKALDAALHIADRSPRERAVPESTG